MKKLNYLLLGLAGLTMVSCSNDDDLLAPSAGDGNTTFKLSLPGMGTRALGDGRVSLDLQYAVYEAETDASGQPALGAMVLDGSGNFTTDDPYNTTVNMNLAAGKSYYVAFFANKSGNGVYTFNTTTKQLEVNYGGMNSANNLADAYDCFYQIYPTGKISGSNSFNVTLNRPVAQINWGTNDLIAANKELQNTFGTTGEWIQTNLTVTVPNTMDFLTKAVSGEEEITLKAFAAPQGETFPVGTTGEYQYVAVQYLLAPQAQTVYDLNLNINNSGNPAITQSTNDVVVSNAPVQANFRTNIFGSLLSNNVEFNITKGPWEDDYDIMLGESQPEVKDGAYLITNQAELTWIANQVNSGKFDNKPIELQNDIYMTGDWIPIGTGFSNRFNGTFNGNNHTIYNLKVESNDRTGFFGFCNGVVSDLNFDNAYIVSNHWAGVVAGYSDNETGSCKITNCNVSNSTVILSAEWTGTEWDNGDKGGMIIGYMVSDYVEGCTVTNCTLQGYRDLGGIIGYANGSYVNNNTVEGLTIYIDNSHNYKGYSSETEYDANGVIGEDHSRSNTGNKSSNVNVVTDTVLVGDSQMLAIAVGGATEGTTVKVMPGTYTFPSASSFQADGIVIDCEPGVVFTGNNNWLVYSGKNYGLRGAIIKNAKFSNPGGTAVQGYLTGSFENCVFEGSNAIRAAYVAAPEVNFSGCTFIGNGTYAFHIDSTGAAAGSTPVVNFNDCNFDGFVAVGKGKVITYKFNGCNFTVNKNSTYGGGNFYGDDYFVNCTFDVPSYNGNDNTFQWVDLNQLDVIYDFTDCYISNGQPLTIDDYKFRTTQDGVVATINGVQYNLPNNK